MYETITLFRGMVLVFLSTKLNSILLHRLIIHSIVIHSYLLLFLLITTYISHCFTPFIFSQFSVCPHLRVLSKLRMSGVVFPLLHIASWLVQEQLLP